MDIITHIIISFVFLIILIIAIVIYGAISIHIFKIRIDRQTKKEIKEIQNRTNKYGDIVYIDATKD